ncbi:MAG: hypothetical protein A3J28_13680 [Acidobacteria bacterium RIFCSPLOWO2_12_FULL_60_22]|nr:MAG: hypothetical protein A3J28_13680 [Acidobacteria bacterium RIFCSPLOWO2_12_FULL_60_22]
MPSAAEANDSPLIQPEFLAKQILAKSEIWPRQFLDPEALARFCSDRGIRIWDGTLVRLWQLGLLRADLIISPKKFRKAGLIEVGKYDKGNYAYADARQPARFSGGFGAAASQLHNLDPSIKLYFHPFRYYVLCKYDDFCRPWPRISEFTSIKEFQKLKKLLVRFQKKHSDSGLISRVFLRANEIAALAIAAEPCVYELISGHFRFPAHKNKAAHRKDIEDHWQGVRDCYKKVGLGRIKEAGELLSVARSRLDPNRDLHDVMRLAEYERMGKIRGHLGGALFLNELAETIRRGAEKAFGIELPEEGETWSYNAWFKKDRYGSKRIFDGDPKVAKEVLKRWWQYGVRLRWYVEGHTELGALQFVFGSSPAEITLVNLRGLFVEKKNKLAFRDSLRIDFKDLVFSFVSLDRDVSDNLSAVIKAAEDDEICGRFFASDPDFEFANFTITELEEVLWQIALGKGADAGKRPVLHRAIRNTKKAGELEKSAKRSIPELNHFKKDKEWGRRLMEFALRNPTNEKGSVRPILNSITEARRFVCWYDYKSTKEKFRVDPNTGECVERKKRT